MISQEFQAIISGVAAMQARLDAALQGNAPLQAQVTELQGELADTKTQLAAANAKLAQAQQDDADALSALHEVLGATVSTEGSSTEGPSTESAPASETIAAGSSNDVIVSIPAEAPVEAPVAAPPETPVETSVETVDAGSADSAVVINGSTGNAFLDASQANQVNGQAYTPPV